MNNTPAFVSPATFEIDGRAHPAAITAALSEDGQLMITLQPLCQLPAGITDFFVVIDDEDLRSVNALLRAQAEAEREADIESAPDGSRVLVRAEGWDHLLSSMVVQATQAAAEDGNDQAA